MLPLLFANTLTEGIFNILKPRERTILISPSFPTPQCWPTTSFRDFIPYGAEWHNVVFFLLNLTRWHLVSLFSSFLILHPVFQLLFLVSSGLRTFVILVPTLTSLPFVCCMLLSFYPTWQRKWMTAASVLKLETRCGIGFQLVPHLHRVLSVFFFLFLLDRFIGLWFPSWSLSLNSTRNKSFLFASYSWNLVLMIKIKCLLCCFRYLWLSVFW